MKIILVTNWGTKFLELILEKLNIETSIEEIIEEEVQFLNYMFETEF